MEIIVDDTRSTKDKIKDKISEMRTAAENKANEMLRWTADHSSEVIGVIPVVIAGTTGAIKLIKAIRGSAAERHEERMSHCYYDPSTGVHWDLKRDLNNSERAELVRRKRDGEYAEDILADMRVLRK